MVIMHALFHYAPQLLPLPPQPTLVLSCIADIERLFVKPELQVVMECV